ncbi:MAG: hypothetical protein ACM3W4_01720 [Ignavibacteriales bacterium]
MTGKKGWRPTTPQLALLVLTGALLITGATTMAILAALALFATLILDLWLSFRARTPDE